jgi:hypothetical protein
MVILNEHGELWHAIRIDSQETASPSHAKATSLEPPPFHRASIGPVFGLIALLITFVAHRVGPGLDSNCTFCQISDAAPETNPSDLATGEAVRATSGRETDADVTGKETTQNSE